MAAHNVFKDAAETALQPPGWAVSLFAFGVCVMRSRRSVSCKCEKNKSAEKARLEALLAELNAQLAFLNEARPKMALLRKRIRQLDAEGQRRLLDPAPNRSQPPV